MTEKTKFSLRLLTDHLDPVSRRLLVLLFALLATFGLLLGEQLFNPTSLGSMAYQLPELGILSLAMMVALLSGGLDLSIIAMANLVALAIALILKSVDPASSSATMLFILPFLAVGAGLLIALALGAINGFIIAYLGVSPILTTLGAMTLLKGISIGLSHGAVVSSFPAPIVEIGNGTLFGVPIVLLIFLAVAALTTVLINKSTFGHTLKMLGSNESATRFSGIDTRRTIVKTYMTSSLLAAVAGFIMMARFDSASAAYGESYLLITILAAVLGGVSPSGGFGRVGGLVLALLILQLISTAFNLLNLSQFLTLAIWGGILIAVGAVERLWRSGQFR